MNSKTYHKALSVQPKAKEAIWNVEPYPFLEWIKSQDRNRYYKPEAGVRIV